MSITQPTENPNIPGELINQVTAVRNQITLNQAEVQRLSQLAISSKHEINEAVKKKVELAEQIGKLNQQVELLTSQVEFLDKEKTRLEIEKNDVEESIKLQVKEFSKKADKAKEIDAEIKEKSHKLDLALEKLNKEKAEHEKEKTALNEKVERINQALK